MADKKTFVSIKDSPIIRYWDYEHNAVDPATIASKSGKRYRWICPECGCSHKKVAINMHKSPRCKNCGKKAAAKTRVANYLTKGMTVADNPELLRYWDYANNTCAPGEVTIGNSSKKCYWICSKCGTSHKRTPYNEQKSTLCQTCGHKKGIANGYNKRIAKSHSIADDPILSKCWDYANNTADPSKITYRSNNKYKWICPWCGIVFERTASHMCEGHLCNDCTNKRRAKSYHDNYMLTAKSVADDPELLKCWDFENNARDPHDVSQKSNDYFYWICPKCGKSFRRTGNNQYASLRLCDDCASDVRVASHMEYLQEHSEKVADRPNMMAMWDYENNAISPNKVLAHSTIIECYWKCPICGKLEKAAPDKKYEAKTCWDCGNKIAGVTRRKSEVQRKGSFAQHHPHLAKEWHPTLNGNVTPYDVTSGCGDEFYWQCKYGHTYKTTVVERVTRHAGCPTCKTSLRTSFTEQAIAFYLSKVVKVQQHYKKGGFNFDIFIEPLKAVVEYDGMFWHSKGDVAERDSRKDKYCQKKGWRIIRVKEADKVNKVEGNSIYAQRRNTDYVWLINKVCSLLGVLPPVDIDIERDTPEIYVRVNPIEKHNSFAEQKPELLRYWHYEANAPVTPDMVLPFSHMTFSWRCPNCGHEWKDALVSVSSNKNVCPKCRKKALRQKGVNEKS